MHAVMPRIPQKASGTAFTGISPKSVSEHVRRPVRPSAGVRDGPVRDRAIPNHSVAHAEKAAAVPPELYGDDRAHDLPRQNEQDPVVLHPVHEGGCLFGESRQRRCQSFQSHAITPDIRSRYDPAPFNAP